MISLTLMKFWFGMIIKIITAVRKKEWNLKKIYLTTIWIIVLY